jgi:hypothetical protein
LTLGICSAKDWGPGVRAGGKRDFDTMSMQEIIDKRRTASQEKQNKKRKLMEQGVCIKFQKVAFSTVPRSHDHAYYSKYRDYNYTLFNRSHRNSQFSKTPRSQIKLHNNLNMTTRIISAIKTFVKFL